MRKTKIWYQKKKPSLHTTVLYFAYHKMLRVFSNQGLVRSQNLKRTIIRQLVRRNRIQNEEFRLKEHPSQLSINSPHLNKVG